MWISLFSQHLHVNAASAGAESTTYLGVLYIHIWDILYIHIYGVIYLYTGFALHLQRRNMIYLSGEAGVDSAFHYMTVITPWWEVHCFYKR